MNAADRWYRYEAQFYPSDEGGKDWDILIPENEQDIRRSYAYRADEALVFFDEDGWFTMEWKRRVNAFALNPLLALTVEGQPVPLDTQWIYACDPDGTPHDVYCEPIFLSTFVDEIFKDA